MGRSRLSRDSLFQRNGVLRDLVEGGNALRIRLEATLSHDQIGELGGDVDIGQLQRAARQGSTATRVGSANDGLPGSERRAEVGVALQLQPGIVGESC